ncbi:MAG: hypothetical protein ABIH23_23505 [bacterium]
MSAVAAVAFQSPKKRHSEEEARNRAVVRETLINKWSVSEEISDGFAKKHAFLPPMDVMKFVEELAQHHRNLHLSHHGHTIDAPVLTRAMELCLQRLSRTRKGLSEKQLSYFLQFARDQIASQVTLHADPGTPGERESLLKPLREVICCEDDQMMRDRLLFIYRLFIDNGLRLAKSRVLKACISEKKLFPRKRAVEDTLETLRGAYEALGFLDGEFFVAPEYLAGRI